MTNDNKAADPLFMEKMIEWQSAVISMHYHTLNNWLKPDFVPSKIRIKKDFDYINGTTTVGHQVIACGQEMQCEATVHGRVAVHVRVAVSAMKETEKLLLEWHEFDVLEFAANKKKQTEAANAPE